jgi:cytochrome c-type biogenesis protein CcmE
VTRKSRRLILIASCGGVLTLAVGLILFAMSGSIVFFRSPTEVANQGVAPGTRFRLGGLVKDGSLERGPDQTVAFAVTDTNATVQVTYRGLLPDLFREGQGVVTEGTLEPGGLFRADTVLAKHDESYMPREVADALKAQGRWQEGKGREAKDGGKTSGTAGGKTSGMPSGQAAPQAASAGEKTLGPRSER